MEISFLMFHLKDDLLNEFDLLWNRKTWVRQSKNDNVDLIYSSPIDVW